MARRRTRNSLPMQLAIMLGSTSAAFGLTNLARLQNRPFLFPMLGVMVSAIHGGLWAGLASAALALVLVDYFFVPPVGTLRIPSSTDGWQFVTFGLVATAISLLAHRSRNAEERLREQAEMLGAMVAERDELLRREQAARAELEQASRLKDEFLATLSHELRTPLNAVAGWARILAGREFDPVQQRRALDVIYRNTMAQARLVDDVLDLSQVIAGRMSLATEPVDLSEVARVAVEGMLPVTAAKNQRLHVHASEPVVIDGDPHRLAQVIWNLLSNATKFTPEGGSISVRVAASDGHAQLTVTDTGTGIDPAFAPHVFEIFRQQDGSTTRRHGGLGIGLALVKHIVSLHGGVVSATSPGPGQGTTVEVLIPTPGGRSRESAVAAERDTIV